MELLGGSDWIVIILKSKHRNQTREKLKELEMWNDDECKSIWNKSNVLSISIHL